MRRRASFIVFVVVALVLATGFATLWRLRFARGDVYPAYSSLRADALGTRAFFDALGLLRGSGPDGVERSLKPLEKTRPEPPRTLILAGVNRHQWLSTNDKTFEALDAAVRAGTRLVVTFRATPFEAPEVKKNVSRKRGRDADAGGTPAPRPENKPAPPPFDWQTRWSLALSSDADETPGAVRHGGSDTSGAVANLTRFPDTLPWRSGMTFDLNPSLPPPSPPGKRVSTRPMRITQSTGDSASPWRVLYTRANRPVLIERTLGKGSLVFASDSFFVSNEALQRNRATALLAWLVGPHDRIIFDESHLGVEEDTGIAALARRYGLGAAFVTLLLFAALFVWRRMALFVPPPAEEPVVGLGDYRPTAGIEALLRRSVPRKNLASVCLAEWRATARPEDIARADAAIAPHAAHPAEAHNAALRALRRR